MKSRGWEGHVEGIGPKKQKGLGGKAKYLDLGEMIIFKWILDKYDGV
jgi:hypothetical protein